MRITPFPSGDSSTLTRPGLCFPFQPFSTKYWTHIPQRLWRLLPRATSGCTLQTHSTIHHEWRNGLSQIKFLWQSLPLLIEESELFPRRAGVGVDVSPSRAPAVVISRTSPQCKLGVSPQLVLTVGPSKAGHWPDRAVQYCTHLLTKAGHSGGDE